MDGGSRTKANQLAKTTSNHLEALQTTWAHHRRGTRQGNHLWPRPFEWYMECWLGTFHSPIPSVLLLLGYVIPSECCGSSSNQSQPHAEPPKAKPLQNQFEAKSTEVNHFKTNHLTALSRRRRLPPLRTTATTLQSQRNHDMGRRSPLKCHLQIRFVL